MPIEVISDRSGLVLWTYTDIPERPSDGPLHCEGAKMRRSWLARAMPTKRPYFQGSAPLARRHASRPAQSEPKADAEQRHLSVPLAPRRVSKPRNPIACRAALALNA